MCAYECEAAYEWESLNVQVCFLFSFPGFVSVCGYLDNCIDYFQVKTISLKETTRVLKLLSINYVMFSSTFTNDTRKGKGRDVLMSMIYI